MFRPLSTLFVLIFGLAFAAPAHAACTAANANANTTESTPNSAFTVNAAAGIVTHALTGLTWKQCTEGLSGPTCAGGSATGMTWSAALSLAANDVSQGGGWRLPNKKELESIVETCGHNPPINQTAFPATLAAGYWSASSYVPNPAGAWGVNFSDGDSDADSKSYNYTVRLVRGGQSLDTFDAQADSIPSAFSFTAQTGAALGSTATSNAITVAGINTASAISIAGGTYSINSGSYTSAGGTVSNGNTVTLQQTASASPDNLTTATLTIGGISAAFDVTTGSNQATLSVNAPASLTYGGATGTMTASGGSGGGALTYSAGISTGCAVLVDVLSVTNASGTCTVTATKAADASYLAATSSGATVPLNKTSQGAVTLNSTSGNFGSPLTLSATGGTGTGAYSYAVNNAGAAGCAITGGGTTLTASTVGSCDVIATRVADNNYNAASSSATSVTFGLGAQAITFGTAPTVVVGGTGTVTTTGGGSGIARVYASSSTAACTVDSSTGVVTGVAAGPNNCTITADQAGNTNYSAAAQASLIFSINVAPYTKIANNGADLADAAPLGTAATDWACTRDNASGLVWEVKTRDDTTPGLRDWIKTYTNYDSSYGTPDQINAATNSIGFTNAVNDTALCGSVEWRMPSTNELLGIVKSGVGAPTIDTSFFPNTQSSVYWSGSTFAGVPTSAEYVHFFDGISDHLIKTGAHQVRLVRGGPSFATSALTVTASGSGAGSVTTGGLNCARAVNATTGTCSVGRGTNSVVTLTATATTGNVFVGWSGGVCSGTSSTCTLTMDADKAVAASFDVVDTSPDAFSFTAQTGVALGATATSNTITVAGINSASPISISGGSYKIGSGSYVTNSATVVNGDTVTVQQSASASPGTLTTATLTIGGISAAFDVTTLSNQTITGFSPVSPVVLGAAAATLSATGGASGNAIVYATTSAANVCTVSGTTVTFTGVGTCNLTANQAGNGSYSAAPQVTASIVINAAPAKTYTGASPTGPGSISAAFTGGNGSCAYATSQFSTQTPPTGVALTYGVFNFTTNDCGAGSALNFTIIYPQNLPTGTVYYKYGPEFGASQTPHWYVLPGAVVSGNQISFTITDNGTGDSNPAAGFITDPGGPGVSTLTTAEPITLEVPVVPLIPPLASLPALPGVGNGGRVFLSLAEGAGPSMTGCLRTTLNDLLGPDWLYQGQSTDGGARLKRATDIISFYPIEASTITTYGLGQGTGVYLRTTNPLSVVTGCGTFVTAPALYSLGEFGALLNAGGLTAQINAQGVITYPTGSLTYAVRPGYWVTQGNPGAPALTTGADGQLRFTDSAGLSQILYPAFLDPELLGSQVSQAVGGWTVIQTDGTALVTLFGGQQFVLTPDLALGSVPPGTMTVWWQDGPNHFSYRNSGFSNTSQGFSVSPR